MTGIINLWNVILESNTFNFVILVIMLAVVAEKLKLSDVLSKVRDEIVQKIENSKQAKINSETTYSDAKQKVEHLDEEVAERLSLATQQANNVGDSIKDSSIKKQKQIEENAIKIISAEEKTIFTNLSRDIGKKAIEHAEKLIREKLESDTSLHDKYIEDCIQKLERIAF